jgi:superfamily II DNA/RNA helicase
MKPESRSLYLLSITQAKAKMYEYAVPEEHHIPITRDPARLFTLAISLLGDLAVQINTEGADPAIIQGLEKNLSFSARFFDSYFQAKLDPEIYPYLWILGSASYYLSALPGSSLLLAKNLERRKLDMEGAGLENLLLWILLGEYNQIQPSREGPFESFIQEIEHQYQQYYSNGTGEVEIFQSVQGLRNFVYTTGTPRQLLFADIIGAITRKKYQNSTWFCLPRYSDLTIDQWRDVLRKPSFSIKELWPAQHLLGQHGVFRGKSAIVQMPTSAGKTKATEIIIRSAFISDRTALAVIVAPFRALCHEIRESLIKGFRSESIFVNELSDVLQPDYSVGRFLGRKQVLVVTPEKLNYVLRHTPVIGERIGLIIYDEGHQFDNGTRGITYELLLTSLKEKLPEGVQSVLISAVISNGEQVGQWLNGENSENVTSSSLIPTYRSLAFASWTERLGRLYYVNPQDIDTQEFFVPRLIEQYQLQRKNKERIERIFPQKSDGKEIALYLGLKIAGNGSVAIFCGTKNAVATMCEKIVDIFTRQLPMPIPYQYSNQVEANKLIFLHEANLGANATVTLSARLGIFAHHNNIPHGIRLAIEYALKEGMVNFVICTSTLAQGVNLPLRYLIITSTYQGEEQIRVRDFQNLMGRTGRAKFHTEGSILFSDPEVFDTHTRPKERWRWRKVKELLNPTQSEPCNSTLFSIFDPLENRDKSKVIQMRPMDLVEKYITGMDAIQDYIESIASEHNQIGFNLDVLEKQVRWKLNIISKIESYLMAHCDNEHPELVEKTAEELAKGTLAYFLADEDQKIQIVSLFSLLAHNINQKIPEPQKRIVFGKTLYGLVDSLRISSWVELNIHAMVASRNDFELLNILWPILVENIHNPFFVKCSVPDVLKKIALEWIQGKPFFELFEIIQASGAKIIAGTQLREYKIENIIDICENGLSYDGMLVLGAVSDFLELSQSIETVNLLSNLQNLQKRLKYGLASPIAFTLYEMGFSDRIVSIALIPVFEDLAPERDVIIQALQARQERIFEVLDHYPSYFSEVYRNLTD